MKIEQRLINELAKCVHAVECINRHATTDDELASIQNTHDELCAIITRLDFIWHASMVVAKSKAEC